MEMWREAAMDGESTFLNVRRCLVEFENHDRREGPCGGCLTRDGERERQREKNKTPKSQALSDVGLYFI